MKTMHRLMSFCCLAMPLSALTAQKHPDCTGYGDWPATMVLRHRMSDVVDRYAFDQIIDYNKVKIVRLSSVKVGIDKRLRDKPIVYRQIHHITYYKKSGEVLLEAITDGRAYQDECSSQLTVYEISKSSMY